MKFISAIFFRLCKACNLKNGKSFKLEYFRSQGAQIGEGCHISARRLGTEPYLVKLGRHVKVEAGVTFMTHDGGPWIFRDEVPDLQVFGPIVIEDNCVIEQNAILFPNIRIGANSIVGAGSVVISNVPPDTIVVGIPARSFGKVAEYKEQCVESWAGQRPPDCRIDEGENWWNSKHFIENSEKLKKHLLKRFEKELGVQK